MKMTNSSRSIERLCSLIGDGEEAAVHRTELMQALGLADRELRRLVEYARRSGICIASGDAGYFFPRSLAEVRAFRQREEARARSIFYTLRTARQLEKRLLAAEQDGEREAENG